VDVTHGVFRLFITWRCDKYFTSHDRYALLVSSIGHDLGHAGFTNPFLIETSHELALRYNDKSPLENMHCARLFEITGHPKTDVFIDFGKKEKSDVRKICIEAILHTDTARHFEMIKEVQVLYEVHSDMFQEALLHYDAHEERLKDAVEDGDGSLLVQGHGIRKSTGVVDNFPTPEVAETFRHQENRGLLRKMILHTADISNPTKPFRICRVWAWKICEEFFFVGDNEKALGLPVQTLNDRDNLNRAFSQVGFIEFLAAPLAFVTMKVVLPFEICVGTMVENTKKWQEQWLSTTKPTPGEEEQKAMQQRIEKLEKIYAAGGKAW